MDHYFLVVVYESVWIYEHISPDIIRGQKVSDIPGTGTAGCLEPPNVGTHSGPL